ncbi:hypothetical protein BSE24067_04087 [Burkholderia seminalis]|nr:hypothetical protein BSE24067_04087 [Burkholderia seminalis]
MRGSPRPRLPNRCRHEHEASRARPARQRRDGQSRGIQAQSRHDAAEAAAAVRRHRPQPAGPVSHARARASGRRPARAAGQSPQLRARPLLRQLQDVLRRRTADNGRRVLATSPARRAAALSPQAGGSAYGRRRRRGARARRALAEAARARAVRRRRGDDAREPAHARVDAVQRGHLAARGRGRAGGALRHRGDDAAGQHERFRAALDADAVQPPDRTRAPRDRHDRRCDRRGASRGTQRHERRDRAAARRARPRHGRAADRARGARRGDDGVPGRPRNDRQRDGVGALCARAASGRAAAAARGARCGARRSRAHGRRHCAPAVSGADRRRDPAALSADLGLHARPGRRRRDRRLSRAGRFVGIHVAVRHASSSGAVGQPGRIRSGELRIARADAAQVRVLSVRRRDAQVHRLSDRAAADPRADRGGRAARRSERGVRSFARHGRDDFAAPA